MKNLTTILSTLWSRNSCSSSQWVGGGVFFLVGLPLDATSLSKHKTHRLLWPWIVLHPAYSTIPLDLNHCSIDYTVVFKVRTYFLWLFFNVNNISWVLPTTASLKVKMVMEDLCKKIIFIGLFLSLLCYKLHVSAA